MATINLGRIKPVNKGTWSNSTAYAIDDFVQYTDNGVLSTYIAVATSTNQAPSTSGTENSTYWKFMAKGVADSLSGLGNNKIVTTDSSGNATGLSIGTAGQFLKVNSGATGYEYGSVSSVFEKIDSGSFSGVSYIDLDGTAKWGTANTYIRHFLVFYNTTFTESTDIHARQIASGTLNTSSIYSSAVMQRNSSNSSAVGGNSNDGSNNMKFTHDQLRGNNSSDNSHSFEMRIGGMHEVGSSSSHNQLQILYQSVGSNQDGNTRMIGHWSCGQTPQNDGSNTDRTGLRIYWSNGNATGNYVIYGFKV